MQRGDDFLKKWEDIINDVDLNHIPLECVKKVVFRLLDNRQKTINLKNLKRQNLNFDEIGAIVERYLAENEDSVVSMEFVLDVEAVAELLQPETDKLLRGI